MADLRNRQRLIAVAFLGGTFLAAASVSDARKKEKNKYSVRMSELVVTATGISTEPILKPPNGDDNAPRHRLVVIRVKISNVGKQFPCTEIEPFLEVKPYYQYQLDWGSEHTLPNPKELLPGETIEGDYTFLTRDGTVPVALVLKAKDVDDRRCTVHPDWVPCCTHFMRRVYPSMVCRQPRPRRPGSAELFLKLCGSLLIVTERPST